MKTIDDSIQYLKSVGPKRAEIFAKVGIKSVHDLLFYFPSRYLDRSTILTSSKAMYYVENGFEGEISILGRVVSTECRNFNKRELLKVHFRDEDGFFECIWFQGIKYYKDRFSEGETYLVSAKPTISNYGYLQFVHPDFDKITEDESQTFYNTGKIIPFYRIPKELKSVNIGDLSIRKMISYATELYLDLIEESLPASIIAENNLMKAKEAVRNAHFPENSDLLQAAKDRFKYEELFYLEILVALKKSNFKTKVEGKSFGINSRLVPDFVKSLPFELTTAQKKVLTEIKNDLKSKTAMNRLLQGDVGSGKTIVALIAMLIVIDNGCQAAIMAPTEILADQHYRSIRKLLEDYNQKNPERTINVSLIIGGQKKKTRKKEIEDIQLHNSDIIIGTHAIFEEEVVFEKLGMVVIDEQHRFGVAQRAKLVRKGFSPDTIVMSATPIPRTLSLTVYGDLDVSVIDEMPKNRLPIKTYLRGESKLPEIYSFIIDNAKKGIQSFIVYPLVEESEKIDLKAAIEHYEELSTTYLSSLRICLIHGRMKWSEKEEIMAAFAKGDYDVLIATTVIEVGIDIPNANIMLINDAHRFGLSQLHQLRGRVGRGNQQAYCILATKDEIVASSKRFGSNLEYLSPVQLEKYKASVRLQAMVKYLDGFKVAEIDLKLRGPGDIFGIKQSGFPEFKFADITTDTELLIKAKNDAFQTIQNDPQLEKRENHIIKKNVMKFYSENLEYAKIG